MKSADEIIKGCEHDGSYIPVNEVKRLIEAYHNQFKQQVDLKQLKKDYHKEIGANPESHKIDVWEWLESHNQFKQQVDWDKIKKDFSEFYNFDLEPKTKYKQLYEEDYFNWFKQRLSPLPEAKENDGNKRYFVLNGTQAGDFEECDSLQEAKEIVKELVYDSNEGYHPDAETVIILSQEFETVIDEEKGLQFNPLPKPINK